MPQIAVEYVILVPLLILQIFLFPMAASFIMNSWTDSSMTLALQNAASDLGSSIQQLYFSMNSSTTMSGNVTCSLNIPPFVAEYPYAGSATLVTVSSSSKVLDLTLTLKGPKISAASVVTLGQNVQWTNSTFMSNSTTACISAYKDGYGTIWLSFKP